MEKRKVICLTGSVRFGNAWREETRRLTLAGHVVLSAGWFPTPGEVPPTPTEKETIIDVHRAKIGISDEIFVMDVNGYVGEDTKALIDFAKAQGKVVRYLSRKHADEPRQQREKVGSSG